MIFLHIRIRALCIQHDIRSKRLGANTVCLNLLSAPPLNTRQQLNTRQHAAMHTDAKDFSRNSFSARSSCTHFLLMLKRALHIRKKRKKRATYVRTLAARNLARISSFSVCSRRPALVSSLIQNSLSSGDRFTWRETYISCHSPKSLHIRKRALYIWNRALYIRKRALYIWNTALFVCNRALHM